MAVKRFTFKTEKATGKWRSFYNDAHYIKLGKIQIGMITPEHPYNIRLRVIKKDINEDKNPNCKWRWVQLAKDNNTLQEAKEWVNSAFLKIIEKYKFPEE